MIIMIVFIVEIISNAFKFGWVGFYGMSTIVGYLMPNPVYYIYIKYKWFLNTFGW